MAKPPADEIQILHYFEDEPLEKATILFKIVSEKMRERMGVKRESAPKLATPKRIQPAAGREPPPDSPPRSGM